MSAGLLHAPVPAAIDDRLLLRAMDAALHDLSQPLTSVALALEVVAREQDPVSLEHLLAAAREECGRAMRDVEMLRVQTARMLQRAESAEGNWA